jgi:hypothetical protein
MGSERATQIECCFGHKQRRGANRAAAHKGRRVDRTPTLVRAGVRPAPVETSADQRSSGAYARVTCRRLPRFVRCDRAARVGPRRCFCRAAAFASKRERRPPISAALVIGLGEARRAPALRRDAPLGSTARLVRPLARLARRRRYSTTLAFTCLGRSIGWTGSVTALCGSRSSARRPRRTGLLSSVRHRCLSYSRCG